MNIIQLSMHIKKVHYKMIVDSIKIIKQIVEFRQDLLTFISTLICLIELIRVLLEMSQRDMILI